MGFLSGSSERDDTPDGDSDSDGDVDSDSSSDSLTDWCDPEFEVYTDDVIADLLGCHSVGCDFVHACAEAAISNCSPWSLDFSHLTRSDGPLRRDPPASTGVRDELPVIAGAERSGATRTR
jgi:hypothetical protein